MHAYFFSSFHIHLEKISFFLFYRIIPLCFGPPHGLVLSSSSCSIPSATFSSNCLLCFNIWICSSPISTKPPLIPHYSIPINYRSHITFIVTFKRVISILLVFISSLLLQCVRETVSLKVLVVTLWAFLFFLSFFSSPLSSSRSSISFVGFSSFIKYWYLSISFLGLMFFLLYILAPFNVLFCLGFISNLYIEDS